MHHLPHDANLYLIRFANVTAGLLSAVPDGFRFHSASARFDGIDGKLFSKPEDAAARARELRWPPIPAA